MKRAPFPLIAQILFLAIVYFAAAKLGLSLAALHKNVTPIWPPTGIAIAALLIFGRRVWPGVFLGALATNVSTEISIATASGIATGNTLEALVALWLLQHIARWRNSFSSVSDVMRFVACATVLAPVVSATIGSFSLCLGGVAEWANFWPLWLTWWIGDGFGAMIVTPFILSWRAPGELPSRDVAGHQLEIGVLLLLHLIVVMLVFGGWFPGPVKTYPLAYLSLPFLLWAALKFDLRIVTSAIVLMASVAVWGTKQGYGPWVQANPNVALILLISFVGTSSLMTLIVSAIMNERRRAGQEAEEASRLKEEFLATVSHELRTPLNAVVGWSRLVRSGQLDQDGTAHALEVIERNASAQRQIIEDLLDVSRIIAGKLRINMQQVDLLLVIHAAIDAVRPAAEAKEIDLRTHFEAPGVIVKADAERLQQILWNLLANAVKFTPQRGTVDVYLRRRGAFAEVRIEDSGPGIPVEFLPRVFDRFTQADGSNTRKHGGLGLGLAIVRHLVEIHGGTVSAGNRNENGGAVLTVSLPAIEPASTDLIARSIPLQ